MNSKSPQPDDRKKPKRHGWKTAAPRNDFIAQRMMEKKTYLKPRNMRGKVPVLNELEAEILKYVACSEDCSTTNLRTALQKKFSDGKPWDAQVELELQMANACHRLSRLCLLNYRRRPPSRGIVLRLVGKGASVAESLERFGLANQLDGRPDYARHFQGKVQATASQPTRITQTDIARMMWQSVVDALNKRSITPPPAPIAAPQQRSEPEAEQTPAK